MWHPLLLLYDLNLYHCHHMHGQLFLMNFDEMNFLHLYCLKLFFFNWQKTWLCIYSLWWSNECIRRTANLCGGIRKVWHCLNIINVWFFKLFHSLLWIFYIMVVHLLFLDLVKNFLTCLLLDDVYPISKFPLYL